MRVKKYVYRRLQSTYVYVYMFFFTADLFSLVVLGAVGKSRADGYGRYMSAGNMSAPAYIGRYSLEPVGKGSAPNSRMTGRYVAKTSVFY